VRHGILSAARRGRAVRTKRRHRHSAFIVLALSGTTFLGSQASEGRADPVIVAAGDLCGSATDCRPTARVIGRISPRRVLALGDNAYPDGRLWQYRAYYRPNWGRFKAKTSPVPGNHDFGTPNAQGYRDYFGARAPAFFYSYNVGAWHLIALSSDLNVFTGSRQERWLRRDLARHPRRCILAYWHHPRFTSGTVHHADPRFDPFWRALYAARADVVLNGHVHNYERFARQDPGGHRTRKGIREFVVGTGGIGHYASGRPIKHSQVQNDTTFGVLKLRLHRKSYHWKFVRAAGGRFHDSGTTRCSRRPRTFRTAATTSSRTTGEAPSQRTLFYRRVPFPTL
jgi:Calcineurin-like phosphoesterase